MHWAQPRKTWLIGVALWAGVAGVADAQRMITLEEAFTVGVGESAAFAGGTGVTLTFETVREDSRCPVGATCVWAGDAVVVISVDDGNDGANTVELHTNPRFDTNAVLDGHTLRLVQLAPMPRNGSTIAVDQYQVTLAVRRRDG